MPLTRSSDTGGTAVISEEDERKQGSGTSPTLAQEGRAHRGRAADSRGFRRKTRNPMRRLSSMSKCMSRGRRLIADVRVPLSTVRCPPRRGQDCHKKNDV